jgi:cytochrome c oxidase subunit 1
MTPAFWLQSLGQMWTGLKGMRRRIADYDQALGIETGHLLITIAGFLIGLSVLIMIYNIIVSWRSGKPAEDNPWNSRGIEWELTGSPVPEHSFAQPIEVVGDPYDYGLPGSIYAKVAPAPDSGG